MKSRHFLNITRSLDNKLLLPSPSSSPPLSLLVDAPRAAAYRFLYSPGSSMWTPSFHIPLLAALDDQHNTTISQHPRTETRRLPCFLFGAQKLVAPPWSILCTTVFVRGGSTGPQHLEGERTPRVLAKEQGQERARNKRYSDLFNKVNMYSGSRQAAHDATILVLTDELAANGFSQDPFPKPCQALFGVGLSGTTVVSTL